VQVGALCKRMKKEVPYSTKEETIEAWTAKVLKKSGRKKKRQSNKFGKGEITTTWDILISTTRHNQGRKEK